MAAVWVTFRWAGLLLVSPATTSVSPSQAGNNSCCFFLACMSHFYGLWADWTDNLLLKAASLPTTLLFAQSLRSVLPLNPTPLLQHNTQAITWPLYGGGITHLKCLRCNHNQVTQPRLLSTSFSSLCQPHRFYFVHNISAQCLCSILPELRPTHTRTQQH